MNTVDSGAEIRAMAQELYVGEAGEHFRTFALNYASQGAHVISHAVCLYDANRHRWPNRGAFAMNYLMTVLDLAENVHPYTANQMDQSSIQERKMYDDAWYHQVYEFWAETCAKFAFGR